LKGGVCGTRPGPRLAPAVNTYFDGDAPLARVALGALLGVRVERPDPHAHARYHRRVPDAAIHDNSCTADGQVVQLYTSGFRIRYVCGDHGQWPHTGPVVLDGKVCEIVPHKCASERALPIYNQNLSHGREHRTVSPSAHHQSRLHTLPPPGVSSSARTRELSSKTLTVLMPPLTFVFCPKWRKMGSQT
jgi:hypothetical protein